jgi:hypothetical protein
MFHNDHEPPHFHAKYGEHKSMIGIDPITLLAGRLPRRAERLVVEWASLHQAELADNWSRALNRKPLTRIDPLD